MRFPIGTTVEAGERELILQTLAVTNNKTRAAELLGRSLRILEREHGEQDPKLIPAIEEVAQVLQADSKYPEAEKYLRRALAIR